MGGRALENILFQVLDTYVTLISDQGAASAGVPASMLAPSLDGNCLDSTSASLVKLIAATVASV